MLCEIGEHVAIIAEPIKAILKRKCPTRCQNRRRWLNKKGEAIWKTGDPKGYAEARKRFTEIVMFWLGQRVTPAVELRGHVRRGGVPIGLDTMERWLAEMPVKSFTQSGETWYGLPVET
jgi:hypothetical protein